MHALRSTVLRYHVTRCGKCGCFPRLLKSNTSSAQAKPTGPADNIHGMPQACVHNADAGATMRMSVRFKEIAKMPNACDFVTQTNAKMQTMMCYTTH